MSDIFGHKKYKNGARRAKRKNLRLFPVSTAGNRFHIESDVMSVGEIKLRAYVLHKFIDNFLVY
jgi:hypothetical protein